MDEIEKKWMLFGEPDLGYYVYVNEHGKWEGAIVIYNDAYRMPIRNTKEEATKEAEECFKKLYNEYHEEVN